MTGPRRTYRLDERRRSIPVEEPQEEDSSESVESLESTESSETSSSSELSPDKIGRQMRERQLPRVPAHWRLQSSDIQRVCRHIQGDIFGEECVIWQGYITNRNRPRKGPNINFFFQSKKVALHRLLYSNYVQPLDSDQFLKYTCDNKGTCCNINHLECHTYQRSRPARTRVPETHSGHDTSSSSDDDLTLRF